MIQTFDEQDDGLSIDHLQVPPRKVAPGSVLASAADCGGMCRPMAVLNVALTPPAAEVLYSYAQQLSSLLGAQLMGDDGPPGLATGLPKELAAPADPELVICGADAADCAQIYRMFAPPPRAETASQAEAAAEDLARSAPAAGLLVRQGRWPIRQVLLIISGQEADFAALDWATCIATLSQSTVTVLAMVPPAPAQAVGRWGVEQGLPVLLGSSTGPGATIRQVAQHLVDAKIKSTVRLREGPPDWQIQREVTGEDYDLVIVTAQSCRWRLQLPDCDLIHSILRWSDSPTLAVRAGLGNAVSPSVRRLGLS